MHIIGCILMDLNAYSFWLYSILYASIFIVFNVFCISSLTCSPIDLLMKSIELSEWNIKYVGNLDTLKQPQVRLQMPFWSDVISPDVVLCHPIWCVSFMSMYCCCTSTWNSLCQLPNSSEYIATSAMYANTILLCKCTYYIDYYLIFVATSWRWFV